MELRPQRQARPRGWLLVGTPPRLGEEGGARVAIATTPGPTPPAFSIAPTSAGERDRHYIRVSVCRRYWDTRTLLPWSDVHLPNNCHLSADRVPIPPVPTSGRARDEEIERRRRLDLFYDTKYAPDSGLWDTWFRDEHDTRRASFFAGTSTGPRRPRRECAAPAPQKRGRRRVRGVTPTPSPSPSPSPPPPPRMTEEEEACLVARVMEDSMRTHDELQWEGLEEMLARSAAGEVAIPELEMVAKEEVVEEPPVAAFHPALVGQGWGWSCTAPEMADAVGVNWCPTPPRSPEREPSPREEVVQAPPAVQPTAPVYHAPPAHLWTPPAYVDLVSDDDDTGGQ
ncbi:unnamed protein product [Triticum aestivum]|uniref:Uncharacterized protein n=1 Tax=Triticum aestivum TaxID=4565 RepID=A0A7H4LCC6_WHEAT|nr:unnamed protein product [Triticum aestivum]